eukprot:841091-Amphidinium_carterae.1
MKAVIATPYLNQPKGALLLWQVPRDGPPWPFCPSDYNAPADLRARFYRLRLLCSYNVAIASMPPIVLVSSPTKPGVSLLVEAQASFSM